MYAPAWQAGHGPQTNSSKGGKTGHSSVLDRGIDLIQEFGLRPALRLRIPKNRVDVISVKSKVPGLKIRDAGLPNEGIVWVGIDPDVTQPMLHANLPYSHWR